MNCCPNHAGHVPGKDLTPRQEVLSIWEAA